MDNLAENTEYKDVEPEKLLSMLDMMKGLSSEEKESLRSELKKKIASQASGLGLEMIVLLLLLAIMSSVFVFFGYKLYKSLKDKERKREEKRKLKQQKKKK